MLVLTGPVLATHLALAPAAFGPTRPMWGQCARCTSSIAAFVRAAFIGCAFTGGAFTGGMDAAKRATKLLHHGVKRDLERGAPPDQDVVVTGGQRRFRSQPDELAQAASHPVTLHGVADLIADGETNPRRAGLGPVLGPRAGLQDKGAGMSARPGPCSLGHGAKITPAF